MGCSPQLRYVGHKLCGSCFNHLLLTHSLHVPHNNSFSKQQVSQFSVAWNYFFPLNHQTSSDHVVSCPSAAISAGDLKLQRCAFVSLDDPEGDQSNVQDGNGCEITPLRLQSQLVLIAPWCHQAKTRPLASICCR